MTLLTVIGLVAGLVPAAVAYRLCQRKVRYARAMRHSAALTRRMEEHQ